MPCAYVPVYVMIGIPLHSDLHRILQAETVKVDTVVAWWMFLMSAVPVIAAASPLLGSSHLLIHDKDPP